MAFRRKVGLIYEYNEQWIGGTYYIQNLISALNMVEDEQKPYLIILCDKAADYDKLKAVTLYPYINRRSRSKQRSMVGHFINRCYRKLFKKNLYFPVYKDIDLIFPADFGMQYKSGQHLLFWIPDFQEQYLPEFFSKKDLQGRNARQNKIVNQGTNIVFSSYAAQKDFNKFYPQNILNQFVLQFAVTHSSSLQNKIDLPTLLRKCELQQQYFICSNQFWVHKNHKVVLSAIARLKQQGVKIQVAFSGKQADSRFPDYFQDLKQMVIDQCIEENVRFLGFMDRNEQLFLMQHSVAVIQPSLFEGWSTVIEDAMSLNAYVVAANIPSNAEQLAIYPNKSIFETEDCVQLAEILKELITSSISKVSFPYQEKVVQYGYTFMRIMDKIVS